MIPYKSPFLISKENFIENKAGLSTLKMY